MFKSFEVRLIEGGQVQPNQSLLSNENCISYYARYEPASTRLDRGSGLAQIR